MKKEQRIVESFEGFHKLNESENPTLKIGDIIGYHGREGEIIDEEGGYFIVYFSDTGEEESIDKDEIYSQEFGNEDEIDESVDTLGAPKFDKRLEKRQNKSLELQEYKEQASSIIKGRKIDTYDFDDKMYDAFMRGQDPKDFARKYILDNDL